MNTMFQPQKFIDLMNSQTFVTIRGEETSISNWEYAKEVDHTETSFSFTIKGSVISEAESKSYWINFSISSAKIVDICNYFFDLTHFYARIAEVFEMINYSCYILEKKENFHHSHNNDFYPVDHNSRFLLDVFMPLKSYMVMHGPAYCPRVKFDHLRIEMGVEFDFHSRKIDLYYTNEKVASISSVEETKAFIQFWKAKSEVIERILRQALEIATGLDSSSFRENCNIYCFSEDNHIGFSYYKEKGEFYYFFTSFLGEERFKFTTTDTKELETKVLSYFKNIMNKKRIKALLEGKSENYLYRLLYDIMGYYQDFDHCLEVTTSKTDLMESVRNNYSTCNLEKLSEDVKPNIEYDVEKAYMFGDYAIFIAEDYQEGIYVCKKEETINKKALC